MCCFLVLLLECEHSMSRLEAVETALAFVVVLVVASLFSSITFCFCFSFIAASPTGKKKRSKFWATWKKTDERRCKIHKAIRHFV